jgi:hypothetical protein
MKWFQIIKQGGKIDDYLIATAEKYAPEEMAAGPPPETGEEGKEQEEER